MILKKILGIFRRTSSVVREVKKSSFRSSKWSSVRDEHIKSHPLCEACGASSKIQVHHIKPFHDYPELELDPENLISLCMGINECHINIGHGDSFRYYNPDVKFDAASFRRASEKERSQIIESAKRKRLD